jgi:hypothetical protein
VDEEVGVRDGEEDLDSSFLTRSRLTVSEEEVFALTSHPNRRERNKTATKRSG